LALTRIEPPLDYLRTASRSLLQSFELTRLNNAANIRREIAVLIDQWIDEAAQAMLARWMLEHHNSLHVPSRPVPEHARATEGVDTFPLSDLAAAPIDTGPAPPRYADPRKPLAGDGAVRSVKEPVRIAR
jgi:hypothetical protein